MYHYVYIIKTLNKYIKKTYVGYTLNVNSRLNKHNSGKGAKATRGYKWKVIYKKNFYLKAKPYLLNIYLKKMKKRLSIIKHLIK